MYVHKSVDPHVYLRVGMLIHAYLQMLTPSGSPRHARATPAPRPRQSPGPPAVGRAGPGRGLRPSLRRWSNVRNPELARALTDSLPAAQKMPLASRLTKPRKKEQLTFSKDLLSWAHPIIHSFLRCLRLPPESFPMPVKFQPLIMRKCWNWPVVVQKLCKPELLNLPKNIISPLKFAQPFPTKQERP